MSDHSFAYDNDTAERIVHITDLSDPRAAVYSSLTEPQLRNRLHSEQGLFVAESPKVIRVALDAGYQPVSLLCEERHITGDAADIIARCPEMPVLTGTRQLLSQLTGYKLTRGVLCAMHRRQLPSVGDVVSGTRRIAVIDSVVDTTNIGAIFRSAAALGIDGILLTVTSCDPLNRRAIRVSMGSVFLIPWTWIDGPVSPALHSFGLRTAAMALTDPSVPIDDRHLKDEERLAIILGTEGDGLSGNVIAEADYTVRIPMFHGVDSLNVAAASSVAFWELRVEK